MKTKIAVSGAGRIQAGQKLVHENLAGPARPGLIRPGPGRTPARPGPATALVYSLCTRLTLAYVVLHHLRVFMSEFIDSVVVRQSF